MMMELVVIENDQDLKTAQDLAAKLMESDKDDDLLRLRAQVQLIKAYEQKHYPVPPASVSDIIQYIMEQYDLSPQELGIILGSRSRVTEIAQGKRQLTINMIRRIREKFHVSADVLIPAELP